MIELLHDFPRSFTECFALVSRKDSACRATQQFRPQGPFEVGQPLADHGLGQAEPHPCSADATGFHHHQECFDVVEAQSHCSIFQNSVFVPPGIVSHFSIGILGSGKASTGVA